MYVLNDTECVVKGAGNSYQVTLQMSFNHSFAGNQVFFLAAQSKTQNSDWQAVGTISVP